MIVQPFGIAIRLPQGQRSFAGEGDGYQSFGRVFAKRPRVAQCGEYQAHGHTGFAWAARRELFEQCGLYDACLTGTGDHLMSHAFAGGMRLSPCIQRVFGPQQAFAQHFLSWGIKARDLVGGKLGFVPGRIMHLWHGDIVNRRYSELNQEFQQFQFAPERDLRIAENGLWEWNHAPPAMRESSGPRTVLASRVPPVG